MTLNKSDRHFLERAMALAERGRGLTSPNPLVGAVVVREGRVVGEGFHAAAGQDHAEIVAMKDAAGGLTHGALTGATVYVTLEPCSHHGRTPPCAEALIDAGVARVVVAADDPSAWVHGQGLARLRDAGLTVDVATGDLNYRARRQNDPFRKHVTEGLPFVTYKYAMTLDGRVATESGDSRWISGEDSRRRVHELRAESDAVVVGAGTLRRDDPQLTAREVAVHSQPLRVIIDSNLGIVQGSALLRTASEGPVLLLCAEGVEASRRSEVTAWGAEVVAVPSGADGRPVPHEVARLLAARDVQSVFMEGGPRLAAAWWDAGLVDKVVAFVAPVLAGGVAAPGPLPSVGYPHMDAALRLRDVEMLPSGVDVCVTGYVREPY
ncbi:MAG: bifunctional diaminohydroxyphosphoribosylaminopyrimidine deaminase/5-amino-6-(5-phosphoribosylamino)uracil reductase RibD [Actinobacteria bacterium]|nr:bifunctional diaminohydroxyphosphoribosylaminopyrimidine deaminase/5-amino-6-(5-phosphoribosylamino)uracil reductase RibD [Actinomycetota bacterium]